MHGMFDNVIIVRGLRLLYSREEGERMLLIFGFMSELMDCLCSEP